MDIEQLYQAIRQLTPTDRLRLVERVVHDVAGGAHEVRMPYRVHWRLLEERSEQGATPAEALVRADRDERD